MNKKKISLNFPIWQKILLEADGISQTKIFKRIDSTPNTVTRYCNTMAEKDLLSLKKVGRETLVSRTKKGEEITVHLRELKRLMKDVI